MTVTAVQKDPDALSMTITTAFDAPVEQVWKVWSDPRLLERWWGPPTYPATVVDHDLSPGGTIKYYMTGPEGDRHGGWWRVISVDAPHALEFEDGFSDESGQPNADMPTVINRVQLTDAPNGGTQMSILTMFPSPEAMEQMITIGMDEGFTAAIGQIDELLETQSA